MNTMRKVKEEKIRPTLAMQELLATIDFYDTFSTTNHFHSIEEITQLIFNSSSRWVEALFKIRGKLVQLIGLKSKLPLGYHTRFEVGGYVKFFKIFSITADEVILGADDSHLNFRAVVTNDHTEQYNIKVTTLVHFNNAKGRWYMKVIQPFHRLVVIRMVKNAFCEKER